MTKAFELVGVARLKRARVNITMFVEEPTKPSPQSLLASKNVVPPVFIKNNRSIVQGRPF
jgi:hypothetical protein